MGLGLGGETWQDVTPYRASGAVYVNTTGKPIMVMVTAPDWNGATQMSIHLNGVWWEPTRQVGGHQTITFIVPNNTTYGMSCHLGYFMYFWELR